VELRSFVRIEFGGFSDVECFTGGNVSAGTSAEAKNKKENKDE
jgi:hypothetical protein